MKRNVRFFSYLLLLCMLISLVTGCGSTAPKEDNASAASTAPAASSDKTAPASGEKVKLRMAWQASGQGKEAVNQYALDVFMKKFPNVTVEVENAESGKYASKIAMDVASNNTPDIFTYWRPEPSYGTDKFIEKGALADMSELLNDEFFKDRFDDYAIKTCSYKGVMYGVPENYAFIVMLANTKVLEDCGLQVPKTWNEFVDATNVLKQKGYIPWGISTKAFSSGWERPLGYTLDRYLGSFGETGVLEAFAGRAPFNSENAITACERLYDLVAGKAAEDSMTLDDTQATAKYYNTGRAGFWVNGTYAVANISKEIQDVSVPFAFPEIPGAPYNKPIMDKDIVGAYYLSSTSWADPVKKQYLYELLKIFLSDEIADKSTYEAGTLCPIKGMQLDPNRISHLIVEAKKIADISEQVKWPLGRANPERKEPFYSVYTDFWAGKYSGKEFALKLHDIFYGK